MPFETPLRDIFSLEVIPLSKVNVVFLGFFFLCLALYFVKYMLQCQLGVQFSILSILRGRLTNIIYSNSDFSVSIESIKIRVNWFERKEQFLLIALSHVKIEIISSTNTNSTEQNFHKENKNEDTQSDFEEYLYFYPNNLWKKRVVLFFLRHVSNFTILTKTISVSYHDQPELQVFCHQLSSKASFANISTSSNTLALRISLVVELDRLFLEATDQFSDQTLVDRITFKTPIFLDLKKGFLSEIAPILVIHSMKVPYYRFLVLFQKNLKFFSEGKSASSLQLQVSHKMAFKERLEKQLKIVQFFKKLFSKVEVLVNDLSIDCVPIIHHDDLRLAHCLSFLQDNNVIFLNFGFKSINLYLSRLQPTDTGYDIHFDRPATPLRLMMTVLESVIEADFANTTYFQPHDLDCSKTYELFRVPNVNFTTHLSGFSEAFRYLDEGVLSKTQWLSNLIVSNPILDVGTDKLAFVIRSFLNLRRPSQDTKSNKLDREESIFSKYFFFSSNIWPYLSFNLLIRDPMLVLKRINTESNMSNLVIASFSIVELDLQSLREIDPNGTFIFELSSKVKASGFKITIDNKIFDHSKSRKCSTINDYLKFSPSSTRVAQIEISSLRSHLKVIPKLDCKTELSIVTTKLTFPKLTIFDSFCAIVDDVRYHLYDKMMIPYSPRDSVHESGTDIRNIIFNQLPEWFSSVKLSVSSFYVLLASRSLLIPKELTSQLYIENVQDYVDRSLRQFSIYLSHFNAELLNSRADDRSQASPTESPTGSSNNDDDDDSEGSQGDYRSEYSKGGESPSDNEDQCSYWRFDSMFSSLSATVHHENHKGNMLKRSRICTIDQIIIQSKCIKLPEKSPFVKIFFKFGQIKAHVTLTSMFILLSAIHLLKSTMIQSLVELFQQESSTEIDKNSTLQEVKLGDRLILSCLVNGYRVKLGMSNDFNTLIDGNKLKMIYNENQDVIIKNTLFRLHVESPAVKGYWAQFVNIQKATLIIHLKKFLDPEDSKSHVLEGSNLGFRLNIPNQFVFHQLFDNMITSSKVIQHLLLSLTSDSAEDILKAHPVEPMKLPNCKFTSSRLVLTMEDDPFEAELGMIFKLGLIEQKARLAKRNSFLEMAKVYINVVNDIDIEQTVEQIEFELLNPLIPPTDSLDTKKLPSCSLHGEGTFEMKRGLRSKLYRLKRQISLTWISTIKLCKLQMKKIITKNSKFLYGPLGNSISDEFDRKLIAELISSPLVTLILESPTIIIQKPTFSSLNDYLYRVGKGLPSDTEYGILAPMNLNVSLNELRFHLKDFPLPMLYIPKAETGNTLELSGNLVIAEQFFEGPASLRTAYVPLVRNATEENSGKFYSLTLLKTIASVKIFTELGLIINGKIPTKINWCISYKPAINQVMTNLDAFSKPQLDPSPKIGFWDKVRSILHGKLIVNFEEESFLHFCIKGSRSPYELLNESAGFVLVFEKNICLSINKNNNSTELITVEAGKVLWGIPNHLSEPLLVWCAETKNSVFLPTSKAFITDTVYYFFLNSVTENDRLFISKLKSEYFEKINIKLTGQVRFVFGFLFERVGDDGKRTTQLLPHYKVKMNNPKFIDNLDTYDAYRGFRSDFIHLTIALHSNEASEHSRNSIHLSPGTFSLFFKWWKLFNGVLALPIRSGKLFNTRGKSQKFSDYLYTIKYQFLIEPLYIAHVYREREFSDGDTIGAIGLLGKVDKFVVDLHQRKEAVLKQNQELELSEKIFKMRMYLGEASLDSLDLRVNQALFAKPKKGDALESECNDVPGEEKVKIVVHDNDTDWFDYDDYNECNLSSLRHQACAVKILPLLSSANFKYFRDTDSGASSYTNPSNSDSIEPFGNEPSHKCLINSAERSEVASDASKEGKSKDVKFSNEFIVKDMLFKWTCEGRNLLLKYIHEVSFMKERGSVLCYESFSKVQKIVESSQSSDSDNDSCTNTESPSAKTDLSDKLFVDEEEYLSSDESVRNFFEELRKIKLIDETKGECNQDYLVKLISPQIQLITHPHSDTMMLVTTPLIELQILSLGEVSKDVNESDGIGYKHIKLETRYGTLLNNANVFCLQKSQIENGKLPRSIFNDCSYGSLELWPPFLSAEGMEDEAMLDLQLLEDTSIVIRYDRMNRLLRSNEDKNDKLSVDVPSVMTSVNSKEFLSSYKIAMELLLYVEPVNKELREKIHKFVLATDFSNLKGISKEILEKHQMLNALKDVTQNYYFRRIVLGAAENLELLAVEKATSSLTEQLFLLVKVILTGGSSILDNKEAFEWRIQADRLLVTMLDVNQTPFVALSVENVLFRRLNYDERYYNLMEVDKMSAYNLEGQVYFPDLLAPMEQNDEDETSFVRVQWEMYRSVAGIQVFKNFDIHVKPFKLQLEQELGEKVIDYIFPEHDVKVFETSTNFQEFTDLQKELFQLSSADEGMLFQEYPTSEEDNTADGDVSSSSSITGSSILEEESSVTIASNSETNPDSIEKRSISAGNDYLSVMSYRAETFAVFNSIKIQDLVLSITFRGIGVLRLINVSDFVFRVLDLELRNKIWSLRELVNYLKKAVLKALLKHTGSLLGNKLKIKKRRKKVPSIQKNLARIRNM